MPRAWTALLKILIQRGLPPKVFTDLGHLSIDELPGDKIQALANEIEAAIWEALPSSCFAEWDRATSPSNSSEVALTKSSSFSVQQQQQQNLGRISPQSNADQLLADLMQQMPGIERSGDSTPPEIRFDSPQKPSNVGQLVSTSEINAKYRLGATHAAVAKGPSARLARRTEKAVKSVGGVFKDVARDLKTAGKEQLAKARKKEGGGVGGGASGSGNQRDGVSSGGYVGNWDGTEEASCDDGYSSLTEVLLAAAQFRGTPSLLTASELAKLRRIAASGSAARRIALAAAVDGCIAETDFWTAMFRHYISDSSSSTTNSTSDTATSRKEEATNMNNVAEFETAIICRRTSTLWNQAFIIREAKERSRWHDKMARGVFDSSEGLQERRVLELVALGDMHSAVGFLLAAQPERSQRFYRDALCALGMAFACGQQDRGAGNNGGGGDSMTTAQSDTSMSASGAGNNNNSLLGSMTPGARTLFVQAAKVITANAASVGDTLLGVPMLCATGQQADATALLQEADLWRYASSLAASSLQGNELRNALLAWATHLRNIQGRLWASLSVLVAEELMEDAEMLLVSINQVDAALGLVNIEQEYKRHQEKEQNKMDSAAIGEETNPFLVDDDGKAGGGNNSSSDDVDTELDKAFALHVFDILEQL